MTEYRELNTRQKKKKNHPKVKCYEHFSSLGENLNSYLVLLSYVTLSFL